MTHSDQAELIWPVLALAAKMQRVMTYAELEGFTGVPRHGQQGEALGLIHTFCKNRGYPALNDIVVKEDTGFPGYETNASPSDFLIERAKVFAFNWSAKEKPRSEDFSLARSATA